MSQVIIPTATNLLTAINDRIVEARRRGAEAQIDSTSQRKRAWLVVKETGTLPVNSEEIR